MEEIDRVLQRCVGPVVVLRGNEHERVELVDLLTPRLRVLMDVSPLARMVRLVEQRQCPVPQVDQLGGELSVARCLRERPLADCNAEPTGPGAADNDAEAWLHRPTGSASIAFASPNRCATMGSRPSSMSFRRATASSDSTTAPPAAKTYLSGRTSAQW